MAVAHLRSLSWAVRLAYGQSVSLISYIARQIIGISLVGVQLRTALEAHIAGR